MNHSYCTNCGQYFENDYGDEECPFCHSILIDEGYDNEEQEGEEDEVPGMNDKSRTEAYGRRRKMQGWAKSRATYRRGGSIYIQEGDDEPEELDFEDEE